jgi:hypothetical protein
MVRLARSQPCSANSANIGILSTGVLSPTSFPNSEVLTLPMGH